MSVDRRNFVKTLCASTCMVSTNLYPYFDDFHKKRQLKNVRNFFEHVSNSDGSFRPGVDPSYMGNSDTKASGIAAPTYAVVIHKTFGWELPYEERTKQFFISSQKKDGAFYAKTGSFDMNSPLAKLYNTVQSVAALRILNAEPDYDPIPVIEYFFEQDRFKDLPLYTTSFFALFYSAWKEKMPKHINEMMKEYITSRQTTDGYIGNHVASTFHAAHYFRLIGEETPLAQNMVNRVLSDQKSDGSWSIRNPSSDVHAAFDALFILKQLSDQSDNKVKRSYRNANKWILQCQNEDGGFSHYPNSGPSDVDATYFHVGGLVQTGYWSPQKNIQNEEIFGWGHLMKPKKYYNCLE